MPSSRPDTIAVLGAGTMGAGIAQLAAQAGARTLLHDPEPGALERGLGNARRGIEKLAAKGRLPDASAAEHLEGAVSLDALSTAGLVIEAVPEKLELKQQLFATLSRQVVAEDCVLATNTSSLPVSAIGATSHRPERVVGMHFFNPPPLMKLVEIVAGDDSTEAAMDVAWATALAMDRTPIRTKDVIGFVVNRVNRPFGLEGARLVEEGIATFDQVDRIYRMAAGFKLGPFELGDLVGLDVGFEVSKSFWEQSFHEPRWRPSPLVAKLVMSGRFGRKNGRGWYTYDGSAGGTFRTDDPALPERGGGDGRLVVVAGVDQLADDLRWEAMASGWRAATPQQAAGEVPWLILDCGAEEDDPPLEGAPQAILLDAGRLAAVDPDGASVGFYALGPFEGCRLVECTRQETTSETSAARAEEFFRSLGRHVEWVGDAPGLVMGRVLAQLVNEAMFALSEGVASADDIDTGMALGLNHPRGPLAWADALGVHHVATLLAALWDEYREERYRPAPLLR